MMIPLLLLAGALQNTGGLTPGPDDVYLRVVDAGPALCTVTSIPGGHYLVYDTGHWTGTNCITAVRDIVAGSEIDLLIISHPDGDHVGEAREIIDEYFVHRMIRTGHRGTSGAWDEMNEATGRAATRGTTIINLQTSELVPGEQLRLGDATLTLIAGWGDWTRTSLSAAERRNVISIVARLDYHGASVLYAGDTIGRRLTDPDSACKDAEAVMVANAAVTLASDVLIAPHHGGNNASSTCFIQAVDPRFVIFSAGHRFHHPTGATAARYLAHGVPADHIYRTDLGDDEGGAEWDAGRVAGCRDGRGDDGVDVLLHPDGSVAIAYRGDATGC